MKRVEDTKQSVPQPANKVDKKQQELILQPMDPMFSLDDIILPENVKEQILEVADYAYNSKIVFERWGLEKRISIQSVWESTSMVRRGQVRRWRHMLLPIILAERFFA